MNDNKNALALSQMQIVAGNDLLNKIASVENNSDIMMNRLRIIFKNGYGISVIHGEYSYGGQMNLLEIAPLDKTGELNGKILNLDNDDVEGYLTINDVIDRMNKIADIKE